MLQRAYVEITNICNLRCDFCPGTRRAPTAMSPGDFRQLAEKLRPHTRYLYLHVMGEPLLHPQLSEILSICCALDFRVCLTTNGFLLPEKLPILRAAPCLYRVHISLHAYEANRTPLTLPDYIRGCVESAVTLSEGGVTCILRLWNRGGGDVRNGEIEYLIGQFARRDMTSLPTDRKGSRRLLPHLFVENADKFHWPGDPAYRGPDAQFCYGLRRQIAVLCDGTVVPCCLDGEGHIPLGNLFTQSIDEILTSDRAQKILRGFDCRQPAEEFCRRCGFASRFNVPL